jgi:hypothetical protein
VFDDAYIFNQSKSTRFEILYLVIENITGYVREKKITKDGISHTTVRDILRQYRIEWRHSKTILDSSSKGRDPEYELKKKRVEEMRNDTPPTESVVLFEDERGSITDKTYGSPSWCLEAKIKHAQKINGILKVLGIYCERTNDEMFSHCYKKRNSYQFLDFIYQKS